MAKQCEDTCGDFEEHISPEMIHEWKIMKRRWEVNPLQPDPYRVVEKGKTVVHAVPPLLTLGFYSLKP